MTKQLIGALNTVANGIEPWAALSRTGVAQRIGGLDET
jgi:hypothetical protein